MEKIPTKQEFDVLSKMIKKENNKFEVYSDDEYGNEYHPYNKSKSGLILDVIVDETNLVSLKSFLIHSKMVISILW